MSNFKKEEIFIDLTKCSEEDIKSIPAITQQQNPNLSVIKSFDVNMPYLTIDNYGNIGCWNYKPIELTEITFSQFKELFIDYKKECAYLLSSIRSAIIDGSINLTPEIFINDIEVVLKKIESIV